jgi:hypothetical protein
VTGGARTVIAVTNEQDPGHPGAPATPEPAAAPPQPGPPPAVAPAPHPGPTSSYGWVPAPDPFVVTSRRWIAPERRTAVIAICAVAALGLFGLGALTGAVVSDDHHHDAPVVGVYRPGDGPFFPPYGKLPQRLLPKERVQPTPQPTPSTTS